jgi:hypothetical protein
MKIKDTIGFMCKLGVQGVYVLSFALLLRGSNICSLMGVKLRAFGCTHMWYIFQVSSIVVSLDRFLNRRSQKS